MKVIDLSTHERLRQAVELYRATSVATDPLELQKEYGRRIQHLFRTAGYISLSTRDVPKGHFKLTRIWFGKLEPEKFRDNWKFGHLLPVQTGGFLSQAIAEGTPKLFQHMNVVNDPVLGDQLKGVGSAVVSPMYDGGEALNWGIALRADPEGFKPEDVEDFFHRANMIGGMVRALVMARKVRELNEQLTAQLEQIAAIQQSLLPERTPDVPGLKIATSYLTSNVSGGDYYDFFDMGGGRTGVLIADVAGHGAGAATVMAMMQTILHDFQERDRGPAAMLTHANRQLAAKRIENSFVTAFMGVIEADRSRITIANAGHNYPILRTAPGQVIELNGASSFPLGIEDDKHYEQTTVPLPSGGTLVLYTDGITEARSPPPDRQMFGTERLVDAVEHSKGDPECVIEAVHEHLFEHTHARDRVDDQTIVALKVDV